MRVAVGGRGDHPRFTVVSSAPTLRGGEAGSPDARVRPIQGLKSNAADSVGCHPRLVRLRRREDGAVKVRSCAVKSRAVSNRNCVAARRGGEHRNENDQSVTQASREGSRRELDSVGVDGRAC